MKQETTETVASAQEDKLLALVIHALEELKGVDIRVLDGIVLTSITDRMVVASGTASRHVKSLAEAVAFKAKLAGEAPIGMEGVNEGEWALVDLNGVVLHAMLPKVRDYYQLEKLWSVDAAAAEPLSKERPHQG